MRDGGEAGVLGRVRGWLLLATLVPLGGAASCGDEKGGPVTTAAALARYAALSVSCDDFHVFNVQALRRLYNPSSETVSRGVLNYQRSVACLESARGCESLARCLGLEAESTSAAPCTSPQPTCEGDVRVQCNDMIGGGSRQRRADCGATGGACRDGTCVWGGELSTPCNDDDYESRCAGDAPTFCLAGAEHVSVSCSAFGRACTKTTVPELPDPVAFCGGTGAACRRRFAPGTSSPIEGLGCEGALLRECAPDEREALVDCGAWVVGASCQQAVDPESGETEHFCGVASDCNPFVSSASCDGNALVFCNGGRVERIDCAELGLGPCEGGPKNGHCSVPAGAPQRGAALP